MFVEINIGKIKWLISCSYNTLKTDIKTHIKASSKKSDFQASKYENFVIMEDFNTDGSETAMSDFMEINNLKNLVKDPNYFKNSDRAY